MGIRFALIAYTIRILQPHFKQPDSLELEYKTLSTQDILTYQPQFF